MELRISDERFNDVLKELEYWYDRKKGTKRDLGSLLGKLVFMSQIVIPGRIFTRRLFDLSCHVKYLHYIVKLSVAARADIDW